MENQQEKAAVMPVNASVDDSAHDSVHDSVNAIILNEMKLNETKGNPYVVVIGALSKNQAARGDP